MTDAWRIPAVMAQAGQDFPLLWSILPVVGVILLAAGVIAWVKRWRERGSREQLTSSEDLAHFRNLFECGEMSAEEFGRVRALLGDRLRKEINISPEPTQDLTGPVRLVEKHAEKEPENLSATDSEEEA